MYPVVVERVELVNTQTDRQTDRKTDKLNLKILSLLVPRFRVAKMNRQFSFHLMILYLMKQKYLIQRSRSMIKTKTQYMTFILIKPILDLSFFKVRVL